MMHGRPPMGELLRAELEETCPATQPAAAECLTTDEYLLLALGQLPDERRVSALQHVEACKDCQVLIAEAATALRDSQDSSSHAPVRVFREGDYIARRYRVERFIGSGGMGEIYAVHDEVLAEQVALKTVRLTTADDQKAVRRLKSEAQLSRRIGHPHTCRIYEFGEHQEPGSGTVYFFTMALISGETLGVRLRRAGPLSVSQAELVARQVLGGLSEAHSLGILHRDLKSDNIMLRSPPGSGLELDAVVMDFGLALRIGADDGSASDARAIVGSLAYMAPEQLEGEKLTAAADIYALGVILFEMLTGQLPFRGSTGASTALKRLHQPPPPPSSLNARLDRSWDDIVLRCLRRVPTERFGSAREVLAALDSRTRDEPRAPHVERRRHAAAVGLLATVLAAAVAGQTWWQRQRAFTTGSPRQHVAAELPAAAPARAAGTESSVLGASAAPGQLHAGSPPAPALAEPGASAGSPAPPALKEPPREATLAPAKRPRKRALRAPEVATSPPPEGALATSQEPPRPPPPAPEPVGPLPIDLEFPR